MTTKKGVWDIQDLRDKSLQSLWSYSSEADPGQLWAIGYNGWGQLAQNNRTDYSSPVQIGSESTWSIIKMSWSHQAGIKTDGTLWIWGQNRFGKLGLNESGNPIPSNPYSRSSPTQIPGTTWANVSCNEQSTFGIKTDGTLWGWGTEGNWGSPGGSPAGHRSSPTQIGTGETWATGKGKLASWTDTGAAINTSGELFTWGRNYTGSLGQNQSQPVKYSQNDPAQVGSDTDWDILGGVNDQGWSGFLALKTNGTLWTCGDNTYGTLAQNDRTHRSSPVQIPGTTWSKEFTGKDDDYRLAIKTDGTMWTWGENNFGQLAQNDRTSRSSPVQVGSGTDWSTVCNAQGFVMAQKTDGTMWSWGYNGFGALGQNNKTNYSSPVQIPGTNWNSASGNIAYQTLSSLRFA